MDIELSGAKYAAHAFSSLFLAFALSSCFEPGGGGAVHNARSSIKRGAPATLELELSAVNPHGRMSHRLTLITCHYRLAGSSASASIPMAPRDIDSRHLAANCTLPPFASDARGPVEYYFDFYFDGQFNKYRSAEDPIKVSLE